MSHSPTCPRPTITRLIAAAILGVLASASCAWADGLFLPEKTVEKTPAIPVQRAVISWKDGVETLILASSVDSDSQKLGWLIPIPAAPQKIELQTPGGLKTLVSCIQPQITNDLGWELIGVIAVAFGGNAFLAILMFKRQWLAGFLPAAIVVIVLAGVLSPMLGPTNLSVALSAPVLGEKTADLASYDITVLKPKEPAEVAAWLAQNGFAPLPAGGDQLIAEYIQGDWLFAAASLARTETGLNTPPPLKIVFESKEAIYPLRLGALAGGKSNLELFVVADRRADCDLLKPEFCDRFERRVAADDPLAFYQGMTSSICVGNPAVRRLMWKGCVLTKLVGSLEAGRMTADLRLGWKPFEDLQEHLYTNRGAIQSAAFYFAWFAGTWACLSVLVCKRRIWEPKGGRWYVGVVLLPAVVLSGAGAVIFYSNVPKLKPSEVRTVGSASELDSDYLHLRISKIIKADPGLLQKELPEIIGSLLAHLSPPDSQVAAGVLPATNRATGGPIVCEDSPGNFTLEKQDQKLLVRVYDRFGQGWTTEYPIPKSAPSSSPSP